MNERTWGKITFVPIREYEWTNDYSFMRSVTCMNHPSARYLTKNPWTRTLHIVQLPDGKDIPRTASGECTCPFSDLAVIIHDA